MHRLSEGRVGHDAGMEFPRPFTTDEYDRRVVAVQAEMARRSMAGLVVVDPASMYYLCGYDAWSFYMPQCVVVPSSGDLHLFTRAMDASGGGITAGLPDDRVHGYPEALVHRPDVHPFDWITDRAVELGLLPTTPAPRSGSISTRTTSLSGGTSLCRPGWAAAGSSTVTSSCRGSGW